MTLQEALQALHRALHDEGSHPGHHRIITATHRHEWPALWAAIDAIEDAQTEETLARIAAG